MSSEAGGAAGETARAGAAPGAAAESVPAGGAPAPGAAADPFSCAFTVRDYELDVQGIVNNANYQHYFEHARHVFLRARGLDFAELHGKGLDAVVRRIEIDYRVPLRSFDEFAVTVRAGREGRMLLVFLQEARRTDGTLCASARVEVALLSGGRPVRFPDEVAAPLLG